MPLRFDDARLEVFVLEWELKYVDFHIDRGVFVPMTDEELMKLKKTKAVVRASMLGAGVGPDPLSPVSSPKRTGK